MGVRRVIVCLQFITSGMSTFLSLSVSLLFSLCLFHLFDCRIRPEDSLSQTREGKEKERTGAGTGSDL